MKKNLMLKHLKAILLLSMVFFITIFTSCEYNDSTVPVITEVRNYAAAPNDTLVTKIVPEQWIVLHGKNLKNAIEISINGSPIAFKPGLFSDYSAVIQVPSSVPFNNVDPDDLNTIKFVTTEGSTTFKFNVAAPPATITGNSLLASNKVGDSIYVYGTNLYLIEKLTIAGVDIAPLKTVSDGSSIGFVFPAINAPQPWEAVVVAASGTYTFTISVEPVILAVSNANPSQDDIVRVFGKNLNGITSLQFGGATIGKSAITEDPDGFWVQFTAPNQWNYASGPVTIVAKYGTATTVYKVNTQNGVTAGLLANFEWGDYLGYKWWGDITFTNGNPAWGGTADFNGTMGVNGGQFVHFNSPVLAAGDSKYCPLGNSNAGNQWVPVANLLDPVENWGLQFEMSVASPWNGGTLYFRTSFAEDGFVARLEPWKISAVSTIDFETDGWQTVTIPLTQFKAEKDGILGTGDSLPTLMNLLGSDGKTEYDITLKNFSDAPTKTGCKVAFDNIRVVKIK